MVNNGDKSKNGYLELLRFIFAIFIIGGHMIGYTEDEVPGKYYHFYNGWIGVEFFFLVTGYLIAKETCKAHSKDIRGCIKGIWKRYVNIFKYYLLAIVTLLFLNQIIGGFSIEYFFSELVASIPNLLMLEMLGVPTNNVFPYGWYLSAMMISILIIYPLAYYLPRVLKTVLFSVCGIGLLISLFLEFEHITVIYYKWGIFYGGLIRAFSVIMIGAAVFELTGLFDRFLGDKGFWIIPRLLLETAGLIVALVYMHLYSTQDAIVYIVLGLAVAVAAAFSEHAVMPRLIKGKFVEKLGRLSFPTYLNQYAGFLIIMNFITWFNGNDWGFFIAIVVVTIVIAVVDEGLFKIRIIRKGN